MFPLRDAYFLPEPPQAIEFRAFTHGLMPRTVPVMMQRFCNDWARYGVDAWNRVPNHWRPDSDEKVGWWSLPEYLADSFVAPMIGAPRGTCIMQPNVHWAMQCLLSAPELAERGTEIVVSETEFPSVLHSVQRWAPLLGCSVRIVRSTEDGFVHRQAVLDAISKETTLIVLSHVGFTNGEKLPGTFLREVAERAHEHDALFVIDGYHAMGSVPVDVKALNVDVYLGGLLKEGSGSSGSCFVYVHPRVNLHPRTTGWFGDGDPFAFDTEPSAHESVRRRFMGGTASVASFYHAVEGARILLETGLQAVRDYSLTLTDHAIERIDEAGLPLCSPRERPRRSAMVILEVPQADRLSLALKERHIYTDSRKGRFLRLAPFVWNTHEEIDRAFDTIESLITSREYVEVTLEPTGSGPVT